MHKINIIILFFLVIFSSCENTDSCEEAPSTENSKVTITLNRKDKEFLSLKSKEELYNFLSENPVLYKGFLEGEQMGVPAIADILYPMISEPSMDTMSNEIQNTFGDFSGYSNELQNAFSLLKHYYPETPDNIDVNIFVSWFKKDIYITPDFKQVYIGPDFFIGKEASYKPNFYEYMLKRYNPESVIPFVMEYVSAKYNKTDRLDNTLLASMVYYGKAYYFTKKMLPCTADSTIIGYDPVEWEGSEMHIKRIWEVFVERELFYETSHFIVGKYVNDRPKTLEVGDNCPGRIGQFLGWKIVNAYMENNPDITLQELMEETDAKKIFTKSKFKPEL